MLGVMTLPAVRGTAADGLLDGFEVGYPQPRLAAALPVLMPTSA